MNESKEPQKIGDYINAYKNFSNLIGKACKSILPTAEQTKESFRAVSDCVNRLSSSATRLYSPYYFSKEFADAAEAMSQTIKLYLNKSIATSQDAFEGMIELINDTQKEQIQRLKEIDFSSVFLSMYESIGCLSLEGLRDIVDNVYRTVQKETEDVPENDTDFLNEEEFKDAIEEQVSNPQRFQQRVKEWTDKKIVRYYIIWKLICFLYSNFFQPYFQQNVGMPVMAWTVSNVRELPQKGASVICQLKADIEALIIENVNYYYKVSFIDENGVKREGYVAKRNLKLIQECVEDEEENDIEIVE